MRATHTYAILEVSPQTFHEIATKLKEAGYEHSFLDGGITVDMHGIALQSSDKDHKVETDG